MAEGKATPQQVRDFFATAEKPVTSRELMDLKKGDPDGKGYDQIANGIGDGTLTY